MVGEVEQQGTGLKTLPADHTEKLRHSACSAGTNFSVTSSGVIRQSQGSSVKRPVPLPDENHPIGPPNTPKESGSICGEKSSTQLNLCSLTIAEAMAYTMRADGNCAARRR